MRENQLCRVHENISNNVNCVKRIKYFTEAKWSSLIKTYIWCGRNEFDNAIEAYSTWNLVVTNSATISADWCSCHGSANIDQNVLYFLYVSLQSIAFSDEYFMGCRSSRWNPSVLFLRRYINITPEYQFTSFTISNAVANKLPEHILSCSPRTSVTTASFASVNMRESNILKIFYCTGNE